MIDAYRLVKKEFPDVQLALVGSMAHDDPEGWDFYNQTSRMPAATRTSTSCPNLEQRRIGRGECVPGELRGL